MGRWRALAGLAWREGRSSRRRLLLYMSSVALGVGALVAIDSLSRNVSASVHDSSRSLLGGDLALSGRAAPGPAASRLIDSLVRGGARVVRTTTFASMATLARTGRTRLAQIRAVPATYPLVGRIATSPAAAWDSLAGGDRAVVDPALLATLDARLGDSLTLGYTRVEIIGTIESVPGDAGISAAIGPRIFIPARTLPATRLLVFGSRADYRTLVALPPSRRAIGSPWLRRARADLAAERVRIQTAADAETNLTNAIGRLTDFLGVVGTVALLLGGIGVASGVTAFVARKIDAAAILRCLGATGPQILGIYVTQATLMGLIGAAIGAAIGVGIQFALPLAVREFLPIDVRLLLVPRAIVLGVVLGLWVALLFALRPLLGLRRISPLQALRRDVDPALRSADRGRALFADPVVTAVVVTIAATIAGITVARAPSVRIGLATAAGIAVAVLALWLVAIGLSAAARRAVRPRWPYVVRQGIANLYRPANQTRAVILALGFGAFLISTLYLVQSALLHELGATARASPGNVLFFDVQDDQAPGLDSTIRAAGYRIVERTPIVTMRIAAINGAPVAHAAVAGDTTESEDGDRSADDRRRRPAAGPGQQPHRAQWALRREYRSTFRDTLVGSERVVAGHWTGRRAGAEMPGISLEDGVASELGVGVGDRITWDVQGVPIETRITSLRDVDWARFEPNFFAVFPAGALESAPKQYVFLTIVPTATATAALQREVVGRYPNVSTIDLSLIRETVKAILHRVIVAIRFLALFGLVMGIPVLVSAVAASRRERVREGVLLKTLGATRAQVGRIMVFEYAALGLLGSLAGIVLSFGGAWALVHFVFAAPFAPALLPTVGIAAVSAGLTIAIGAAGSRDVFAETPLVMLRAE